MNERDSSIIHTLQEPGAPRRKGRWLKAVVVICSIVAAAAIVGGAFLIGANRTDTAGTTATAPATSVSTTSTVPSVANAPIGTLTRYVDRRDSGSISLTVPGALENDEARDLQTVLSFLGFNASAVISRIGNTRALDGTQSAEGRYASVYWTYHPDDGLSMVFEGK